MLKNSSRWWRDMIAIGKNVSLNLLNNQSLHLQRWIFSIFSFFSESRIRYLQYSQNTQNKETKLNKNRNRRIAKIFQLGMSDNCRTRMTANCLAQTWCPVSNNFDARTLQQVLLLWSVQSLYAVKLSHTASRENINHSVSRNHLFAKASVCTRQPMYPLSLIIA